MLYIVVPSRILILYNWINIGPNTILGQTTYLPSGRTNPKFAGQAGVNSVVALTRASASTLRLSNAVFLVFITYLTKRESWLSRHLFLLCAEIFSVNGLGFSGCWLDLWYNYVVRNKSLKFLVTKWVGMILLYYQIKIILIQENYWLFYDYILLEL